MRDIWEEKAAEDFTNIDRNQLTVAPEAAVSFQLKDAFIFNPFVTFMVVFPHFLLYYKVKGYRSSLIRGEEKCYPSLLFEFPSLS